MNTTTDTTSSSTTILTMVNMGTYGALRRLENDVENHFERMVDKLDKRFTTTDMTQEHYDKLMGQLKAWVDGQLSAIQTLQRTVTILEGASEASR
jgi:hypothetical protein